jgi:DNA-binding transcriptional MerR regulator
MDAAAIPEFKDGKAPDALRTIGEVSRALGLKSHVLRYWEEQFPMLRPLTRAGGRRYYRHEDVLLLAEIDRLLHREGYTIRGARQALEGEERRGSGKTRVSRSPVPSSAEALPVTAPQEDAQPADDLAGVDAEAIPVEEQIVVALKVLRAHLSAVRDRLEQGLLANA